MSWTNFAIIIAGFFILYKFVIPRLFPDVVAGSKKLKTDDDGGVNGNGGTYTVQHSNMSLFGGGGADKRSTLRARRKANADEQKTV
jgi:hypothetical protein